MKLFTLSVIFIVIPCHTHPKLYSFNR